MKQGSLITITGNSAYGLTADGIMERFKVKRAEAKKLLDDYLEAMPGVRDLMSYFISFCRRNGYVETPFYSRRRYFPDILSS